MSSSPSELPSILGFLPWLWHEMPKGLIRFTVYHLPNGQKTQETFSPSSEPIAELGRRIMAAGGEFEAEILTTGQVSLTVAAFEDGEKLDIASIICRNEYGFVARAIELLVAKAAARLGRERLSRVPYPEFCKHKEKCAGHSNCQSEFVCND